MNRVHLCLASPNFLPPCSGRRGRIFKLFLENMNKCKLCRMNIRYLEVFGVAESESEVC